MAPAGVSNSDWRWITDWIQPDSLTNRSIALQEGATDLPITFSNTRRTPRRSPIEGTRTAEGSNNPPYRRPAENSETNRGVSASKPTTSSMPASPGSAIVNGVAVMATTTRRAWMPDARR